MTALLLDPHGDDAVLFCCYTLLREKPHVVVMRPTMPVPEIKQAMDVLGVKWTLSYSGPKPDLFILPEAEKNGHSDHNNISMFTWDDTPTIRYLTYAPRGHRSTWGSEVKPTAQEIALKLRALSCFESQIEQASTRPWFFELLDMREFVA